MLLFIKYQGTDQYGDTRIPYKAIVSSFEEAVKTIESWHTYGRHSRTTLMVNDACKQRLTDVFSGLIECPTTFSVTNSGCYFISVEYAHGETVAEHETLVEKERLYFAQVAEKKRAQAKYSKFRAFCRVAKGWYFVSFSMDLLDSEGRKTYKTFSTYVLAESKMDAITKTIPEAEKYASANGGYSLAKPIDWDECDIFFCGMKTDDGFSLEAWKEYNEKQRADTGGTE